MLYETFAFAVKAKRILAFASGSSQTLELLYNCGLGTKKSGFWFG